MRNFSKIILKPLIVTLSLVFASCSEVEMEGTAELL